MNVSDRTALKIKDVHLRWLFEILTSICTGLDHSICTGTLFFLETRNLTNLIKTSMFRDAADATDDLWCHRSL